MDPELPEGLGLSIIVSDMEELKRLGASVCEVVTMTSALLGALQPNQG